MVVVVALSNALFSVDVTHTGRQFFVVAVELSVWKVVMLTASSDSASSLLESVSLAERENQRETKVKVQKRTLFLCSTLHAPF